jgi:peptide/nickel transport system substrate-binding protein
VVQHRSITRRTTPAVVLLFVIAMVAAACGGTQNNNADKGAEKSNQKEATTNKKPVYGGSLTYRIEADPSGGTGGFCLPESQLAISGILVARMFYDTLTVPNDEGGYSPWLAKSVTPNAANDVWTIKLRPGITFHDGTPLDATVVKNNLDAYRGTYPARKPLLFLLVFQNIKDVTVTDPMTVTVTTKTPWPAFPAYLWGSGRIGIMAQKQLDSTNCGSDLIGTGPYKYKEYVPNDHVTGVRWDHYWYKNDNGDQLPYLDSLTLKVVIEGPQGVNGIKTGDLDMGHFSGGSEISDLRQLKAQGTKQLIESDKFGEVAYAMLNTKKPPFDNENARLAIAYGTDRQDLIDKSEDGVPTLADGPFTKGNVGYLKDPGFPHYNVQKAKEYLAKYKSETGKDLEFNVGHTPDVSTTELAKLVQEQGQKLGIKVNLQPIEQGALINTALSGNFQAVLWRNHPGGDPDTQYVWWHSGLPTNFSGINDPEIDKDLDQGRIETDPDKRAAYYEDLNRTFAKHAYNIWTWFTIWAIGFDNKVHDVLGPTLPDGKKPSEGLATGHFLGALWKEK